MSSTIVWIGARQEAKGKDWLWPDGTRVEFHKEVEAAMPWDEYPLCISVSTKMVWQERSCNFRKLSFVCKHEPKAVTGVKNLTLESTIGLDNEFMLTSNSNLCVEENLLYKVFKMPMLLVSVE